jgi:hypothetical protein
LATEARCGASLIDQRPPSGATPPDPGTRSRAASPSVWKPKTGSSDVYIRRGMRSDPNAYQVLHGWIQSRASDLMGVTLVGQHHQPNTNTSAAFDRTDIPPGSQPGAELYAGPPRLHTGPGPGPPCVVPSLRLLGRRERKYLGRNVVASVLTVRVPHLQADALGSLGPCLR